MTIIAVPPYAWAGNALIAKVLLELAYAVSRR
jgi:hypothetical protein